MEITFAKTSDNHNISILTEKLNQHGLICGATGTGKTVTLKVLAEACSDLGIPVILSDVKGDLANLVNPGSLENIQNRIDEMKIENFQNSSFPVALWDPYGEQGVPLRVSISEFGPILLSQVLGLNDTQFGVLNIAFRIADESGLLLLDLKDLKSMMRYMADNRSEVSKMFGNVTSQSISSIQRKILLLEDLGGDAFFAEPSLSIKDLLSEDRDRRGVINILSSKKLISNPTIYSMFLLWLLSELYEELPEVGNQEFPKLVFFFDEAHLLFNNASKELLNKVLQVVRLIRSKGVGVFFVTQNPMDIPEEVSSQLGTKIIHQLRAFSPREIRMIKDVSQGLRNKEGFKLEEKMQNLRTGEAIFSTLDESGAPTEVEKGLIYPPKSSFETLSSDEYSRLISSSPFYNKYAQTLDRESAYELLEIKFQHDEEVKRAAEEEKELAKQEKIDRKKRNDSFAGKVINSTVYSITRQIGREIARGIFGSLKRR